VLLHCYVSAPLKLPASPHSSTYENRLTNELIVYRNKWMMRRKSSGGTLSVNQQSALLSIHNVKKIESRNNIENNTN